MNGSCIRDMTDSEVSLSTQMERKIAALTALNSALTVENEDLRSQLENLLDEADGESTAADLKELQEEFAKRLGAADRNVSELREERDRLRSEVSSLRASNDQGEQRAASLENTVSELRAELDRLDDENRERESNAHRLRHESQSASAEVTSCKQRIQALESSLQEAQERLMAASADAGSREQELEQELQHLQDRSREEVKQANARAQEAKEALEKAHEEHEVLTHAAAQHDELLEQLTSLRISLSQAQVDLAAKEDELLESRALLDRTVRKQDEIRATDTVSQELLSQIDRLTQSLAQTQDDSAQALSELQAKFVAARRSAEEAEDRAVEAEDRVQQLKAEGMSWSSQVATADAHAHELEERLKSALAETAAAEKATTELQSQSEEAAAKANCEKAELEANLRQSTQLLTRTESLLVQAQSDRDQLRVHLSQFLGPHPTAGPSIPPSALDDSGTTSSSSDPAAAVFAQAAAGAVNGASEAGLTGATTAAASSAAPVAPVVHGPDTQSYRYSGTGSVGEEEWSGVHLTRNTSQADMSGLGELWQPNAGARKSSGAGDHAGKLDASVVEGFQAQFRTVEAERDALHTQLLQTFNARNVLAEKEVEVAASAAECARLQTHLDIATEMIGEQNSRISELEEDIEDMKAIFHEQLEEAVQQLQAVKEQHTSTTPAAAPAAVLAGEEPPLGTAAAMDGQS